MNDRIRSIVSAVAAMCIVLAQVPMAHAEDARETVDFNISAQPMAAALTQLGAQSGLTIIVETKVSHGVKAAALSGQYTPEEALKKLLQPAGLKAEYLDSKTVAVRHDRFASGASDRSCSASR